MKPDVEIGRFRCRAKSSASKDEASSICCQIAKSLIEIAEELSTLDVLPATRQLPLRY